MAVGIRNRGVRSATVIDSGDTSTGQKGRITSAQLQAAGGVRVTQEDVVDPARLVKLLNDMQDAQASGTQASRSNPFAAPCIVRNVKFSANQTRAVRHTLGRPYTDWHVARSRTNPPSLVEVELPDANHPGLTSDQYLVLTSSNAGTYTIVIVGD